MARQKKKARRSKKKVVEITIPFKVFFARLVNLGKIEPWREKEIYTFFKSQDLKDKEKLDTYQKMLEKY